MITSTKGLKIYLETGGTTLATVTATAVTNAKPAMVTVSAADFAKVSDGMAVAVAGTGMPSLDGKTFVVGNKGGGGGDDFELTGSDASGDAAGTAGNLSLYSDTADMTPICASAIGVNRDTPSSISVGTFCDTTATIPGAPPSAGELTLDGFIDIADNGYKLLLAAEKDGTARTIKIVFPSNGYLLAKGTVSSVQITDIPLEGAVSFSATMTLSSAATHLF
jgi:hypothetical protein